MEVSKDQEETWVWSLSERFGLETDCKVSTQVADEAIGRASPPPQEVGTTTRKETSGAGGYSLGIPVLRLRGGDGLNTVLFDSCDPMGCSPPGSTVYGILQARTLEWVAIHSQCFFKGGGNPGRQAVSIPVVGKVSFLCTWINWHQISRSPANIHWVHILEFVQLWGPWHGRVLGPATLRTCPEWWWPSPLFPPWDPTLASWLPGHLFYFFATPPHGNWRASGSSVSPLSALSAPGPSPSPGSKMRCLESQVTFLNSTQHLKLVFF